VSAAILNLDQQTFADDHFGLSYLTTEPHYARLAARVGADLAEGRGFVLVLGNPVPDAELLVRCLERDNAAKLRFSLIRFRAGMSFDELAAAYGQILRREPTGSAGNLWPIVSHLMLEARNGVRHVLVLESADALSPDVLLQLNRIAQADEPALLQTVLLTKPSLVGSLVEPSLQFLETAIGTAIRLERLERDEVMVFIQGLLNDVVPDDRKIFSAKTVEAICDAANGDPVIVSRLARGIVDFMRRTGARPVKEDTIESPGPGRPAANHGNSIDGHSLDQSALASSLGDVVGEWRKRHEGAMAPNNTPYQSLNECKPLRSPQHRPSLKWRHTSVAMAVLASLSLLTIAVAAAIGWRYHPIPFVLAESRPPSDRSFEDPDTSPPVMIVAGGDNISSHADPTQAEARAELAAPATITASPEPTGPSSTPHVVPPAPFDEAPTAAQQTQPVSSIAETAPETANREMIDMAMVISAPTVAVGDPPNSSPPTTPIRADPNVIEATPAVPDNLSVETTPRALSENLSATTISLYVQRGNELLSAGDVVGARLFFERAVREGDAGAARGLGRTYDPLSLKRFRIRGASGDPAKALVWYREAIRLGDAGSEVLLKALLSR